MLSKTPLVIASGVHLPVNRLASYLGPALDLLTAISCKGTTVQTRAGNAPPRLTSRGPLVANYIGLQNPGLACQLDWIRQFRRLYPRTPVWLNLHAPDVGLALPYLRHHEDIATIEVNMSCPNVQSADVPIAALKELRDQFQGQILVKLPPHAFRGVTNFQEALERYEWIVDGFVLSNSMPTEVASFCDEPFATQQFGVSGPFLLELNCATIRQLRPHTTKILVGCGGVAHVSHVREYQMAGADLVQLGSSCLWDPHLPIRCAEALLQQEIV